MKRTVLAIAVGAALATAGVAQAEVTIFGKAHLSLDSISSDDTTTAVTGNKSYMYVSSNSSSLGFKEEEDLGDGMKAGLFFDQGITADKSTTAAVFDRQTYVYLGGGFGQVTLGKVESPTKLLGRKVDLFGDQIGDSRDVIADKVGSWGFDTRPPSALTYTSPNMGGVQGYVLYQPEEGTKNGTIVSLRGDFTQGPIFVGAAYESHGKGLSTAATPKDESVIRVAGSFAMGDAKIVALFQSESNAGGNDGYDRTSYGVGGSYKIGAGTVKGQVYMAGEMDSPGSATTNDDTECTLFALGYDHAMSKKTTVYAAYAATANGKKAKCNATAGGHGSEQTTAPSAAASGKDAEDSSALSFGIIHSI